MTLLQLYCVSSTVAGIEQKRELSIFSITADCTHMHLLKKDFILRKCFQNQESFRGITRTVRDLRWMFTEMSGGGFFSCVYVAKYMPISRLIKKLPSWWGSEWASGATERSQLWSPRKTLFTRLQSIDFSSAIAYKPVRDRMCATTRQIPVRASFSRYLANVRPHCT